MRALAARAQGAPPWLWRGLGLTLALAAAALIGAVGTGDNDLGAFFLPAARLAANGHPLALYTVRSDGVPPDDGPLALLTLAVVVRVLAWLGAGMGDSVALRATLGALCGVVLLLVAGEAVRAVERLRGGPLAWRGRAVVLALIAANPTIWRALAHYGHIEIALELWFVLRAARVVGDRPAEAGLWLGLALLARTTAGLAALALGLALLGERRWADAARLTLAAAAATLLGLAPFLFAHPADTLYALIGYRGTLPVGAGSIWVTVIDTPLEGVVQHGATAIIVAGAAVLGGLALRRVAPRGAAAGTITRGPALYALLTLAWLAFPLLSPMVWPYYYSELIVPATIFGATLAPLYPNAEALLLPLIGVLGGLYGEATLEFPPFETIGYLLGIAQCAALVQSCRWLLRRLPAESPAAGR